ncbi:MAG: histidine kinase N-terminal 7TM domain-containing protein, partial [Thermoplasmata archaeon]
MTNGDSAQFVLTLGAGLPIVALVVSAFIGAYVFGLNPRGAANRSALLVMLAFAMWDLGEVVQRSFAAGTSPDALLVWSRFTWVAIAMVPATLYHLALTYPAKSTWMRSPWALAAIYAPAVAWAYLIIATGLIIDGMSSNAFGPSARVAPT